MATTGAFAGGNRRGPHHDDRLCRKGLAAEEFGGDMGTKAVATAAIEQIAITG